MRIWNQHLPYFLLFLALTAPSFSADAAEPKANQSQDDPYTARFQEMDRDKNDTISRDEWPLDAKSFDVVDRNKDGHLSRATSRKIYWTGSSGTWTSTGTAA
jgi:hypothetical protein